MGLSQTEIYYIHNMLFETYTYVVKMSHQYGKQITWCDLTVIGLASLQLWQPCTSNICPCSSWLRHTCLTWLLKSSQMMTEHLYHYSQWDRLTCQGRPGQTVLCAVNGW